MGVNPRIRRALNAAALASEHERLSRLLEAIAVAAIRFYGGEPIAATWPAIAALARRYLVAAADAGVFAYFGIRDGFDMAYVPDIFYPGGEPGLIGVDVRELARLIRRGGTARVWLRPEELDLTGRLEFSGTAR